MASSYKEEVKEEVAKLSSKLYADLSVVDGKPVPVENIYSKHFPDDVTMGTVKAVHRYDNIFRPAMVDATGRKSIEMMKEDPSLDQVKLSVPLIEKDHFDVIVHRKHPFHNPKDGSEVMKYGHVEAQLSTYSMKKGEMSAVKDRLSALALETLCEK